MNVPTTRHTIKGAVLLSLFLFIFTTTASAEFVNGDFEDDTLGWTFQNINGGNSQIYVDQEWYTIHPQSGDRAVRFSDGTFDRGGGAVYQDVDLTDYDMLSFWYRTGSGSGTTFLRFQLNGTTVSTFSSSAGWTNYNYDVSNYTGIVRVRFVYDHWSDYGRDYFVDNVSLYANPAIASGSLYSLSTGGDVIVHYNSSYFSSEEEYIYWDIDNPDDECYYYINVSYWDIYNETPTKVLNWKHKYITDYHTEFDFWDNTAWLVSYPLKDNYVYCFELWEIEPAPEYVDFYHDVWYADVLDYFFGYRNLMYLESLFNWYFGSGVSYVDEYTKLDTLCITTYDDYEQPVFDPPEPDPIPNSSNESVPGPPEPIPIPEPPEPDPYDSGENGTINSSWYGNYTGEVDNLTDGVLGPAAGLSEFLTGPIDGMTGYVNDINDSLLYSSTGARSYQPLALMMYGSVFGSLPDKVVYAGSYALTLMLIVLILGRDD
jgi:hypothetical protein